MLYIHVNVARLSALSQLLCIHGFAHTDLMCESVKMLNMRSAPARSASMILILDTGGQISPCKDFLIVMHSISSDRFDVGLVKTCVIDAQSMCCVTVFQLCCAHQLPISMLLVMSLSGVA